MSFVRNGEIEDLIASSEYIAIKQDSSIQILNTKGAYVDTIEVNYTINKLQFTSDGKKLIVGGDSNKIHIYDASKNFEEIPLLSNQFKLSESDGFKDIVIDPNNKFLIALTNKEGFRMFDFETGKPIVTSLENKQYNSLIISKDGKYIVLEKQGYSQVFDGENLQKRLVNIELPSSNLVVEQGKEVQLKIKGTFADGTTKEIQKGILWTANNVSNGYLNGDKLKGVKVGEMSLKAKYLGFEITGSASVTPDKTAPKLSGVANVIIKLNRPFNPRLNVTAQDLVDGNLTSKIKISGKLNIKAVGTYRLTYSVSDKAGNQISLSRSIKVVK